VAFNVLLPAVDEAAARALARSLRESGGGMRGVQALVFVLPGGRVQLSMNLFRIDETPPSAVIAVLERRGVRPGAQQLVGLCPAVAANAAANGRLLEGRLAAEAARSAATSCEERGGEELSLLAGRMREEAVRLSEIGVEQASVLAGAERSRAMRAVLRAAGIDDAELDGMLTVAARGFRAALTDSTEASYRARVAALDAQLD
ncbi:MAG TPA: hypothetical protein VET26_11060, partial [Candidatus Sulfotelmatobacter sp.]|nr:hypothetical protein [Candidatus Sulfotelmatobacter sp.]